MNFQKILPEQLEVGMKIVVAEPIYYGWHFRTGLTRYRCYTISRITPKRTKIICDDNEFLIKDTIFKVNTRIGKYSPTRFIGTVDEMENCVKIAEELLACRKEHKMIIGDFVETIYGVNGILIAIKDTYYGKMAFIATADGRTFHCPVSDIKGGNNHV